MRLGVAALIREQHPKTAVLLLSSYLEAGLNGRRCRTTAGLVRLLFLQA
jgi:hypothetical protein